VYHWSSRETLGSDAFQETDIIRISTPVTKWNYQITDAAEIPEIMAKAFISLNQVDQVLF
jgi:acetolactate synthase-1/2/3 large subunit